MYWQDGTKPRNKTFALGPVDEITPAEYRVAKRAACAFRAAYLAWHLDGAAFDPSAWSNWREEFAATSHARGAPESFVVIRAGSPF